MTDIREPVIVPLVEGQSEERAVAPFLRRIVQEAQRFDVQVARPIRFKRNQVVRTGELERQIRLAQRVRPGVAALVVLLDADDDCPAELGTALASRAAATTDVPVSVSLAAREIETWLLAGLESLRGLRGIDGDATASQDAETLRGAKERLTQAMAGSRGYVATDDLAPLLLALDLELAATHSPSLERFLHRFGRLLESL